MELIATTLRTVADVMDELLVAYERHTPSIDHKLVQKVLQAEQVAKRIASMVALALLMAVVPAHAFDKSQNPDRYMSLGMDVSTGKLPGMLKTVAAGAPATDGGFVKGLVDFRLPISNAVTMHAFGSSTGVNNNMQFSEGHEVGLGMRVYFRD